MPAVALRMPMVAAENQTVEVQAEIKAAVL